MPNAVVQIPAYEEGRTVYETATEIANQTVPDGWDVDYEAWVTLSPPNRELCDTWQNAMAAENVGVIEAPQGKLSARNEAHDSAVERGYDVFFSWDADAPPLRDGVLASMLRAFEQDPRPACVNSKPKSSPDGLVGQAIDAFAAAEDVATPHIHGQCHALTAEAWDIAGPFDESLDQTSMQEVRSEEEFGFWRALRSVGPVVQPHDAVVYNDPRRTYCKLPFASSDHCVGRVGTFEKDENRDRRGGCR